LLLRGRWVDADREKLCQALEHQRQLEAEYVEGIDFIRGVRLLAGAALDGDEVPRAPIERASRPSIGCGRPWLSKTIPTPQLPSSQHLFVQDLHVPYGDFDKSLDSKIQPNWPRTKHDNEAQRRRWSDPVYCSDRHKKQTYQYGPGRNC